MENVGIFYSGLVLLNYGHLVYFPRFGMLYQEKSGNTGRNSRQNLTLDVMSFSV
jgi:hypothetical protein